MFENLFRLDGKVAVVTGAGNGLGRSFALGLAAFGATVICADRNLEGADETASLAKQSRGKAEAARVDVADETSVDEMWKTIADNHPRIDILVNNAGIATNAVRTHEYSVADWDRLMAINLRGVFLTTRKGAWADAAGPRLDHQHFLDPRPARLLAGFAGGVDQLFGVQGRGDRLHPSGRRRIRRGENPRQRDRPRLARRHGAGRGAAGGIQPRGHQDIRGSHPARIPMKHRGVPDDLVGLVVYLASDASHYVTGQVIAHDGGWDTVVA